MMSALAFGRRGDRADAVIDTSFTHTRASGLICFRS